MSNSRPFRRRREQHPQRWSFCFDKHPDQACPYCLTERLVHHLSCEHGDVAETSFWCASCDIETLVWGPTSAEFAKGEGPKSWAAGQEGGS